MKLLAYTSTSLARMVAWQNLPGFPPIQDVILDWVSVHSSKLHLFLHTGLK